jgi:hypothetical protein
LLSVYCCVECENEEDESIANISEGDFTSRREVEVFQGEEVIGDFTLNSSLKKVSSRRLAGISEISGFYNGPEEFESIGGYELRLNPESSNNLVGSFQKEVTGNDGITYTIKHTHKVIFHEGTNKELFEIKNSFDINEKESFASNEDKYFYLLGSSSIT